MRANKLESGIWNVLDSLKFCDEKLHPPKTEVESQSTLSCFSRLIFLAEHTLDHAKSLQETQKLGS